MMRTKLMTFWITMLGIVLIAEPMIAQKKPASKMAAAKLQPKTLQDKESYAMGVEMVRNLKRQGFGVNLDILMAGMKDAAAGGKLAMTEEEMLDSLNMSASEARVRRTSDLLVAGEDNKKAEEEFLAQNRTKQGVVTLPSGLQYKVLKEGKGTTPNAEDTVELNYRGTLVDGTQFESTYESGQPTTMKVSDPHVIAGLREALRMMPVGAQWQVFIPSRLAFGQRPAGKLIEPYSMLIYELQLVAIK